MSEPDSCKTQMLRSDSQTFISYLASFLVPWLAPVLVAVTAAESFLELIDAKLASLESALLSVMPLLLDVAQ